MLIDEPDLEGNLKFPELGASGHEVADKGIWLKLDGFGYAGHQLGKSCPPPHPFHPVAHKPPPGPYRSVLSGTIRPVSAYGMRRLASAAATAWMSSSSPTSGSRMVRCWLADSSTPAQPTATVCSLASYSRIRSSRARTSLAAS